MDSSNQVDVERTGDSGEESDSWRDHEVGLIVVSIIICAVSLILPFAPPSYGMGPAIIWNFPTRWAIPSLCFAWYAGYRGWSSHSTNFSLLAIALGSSPLFLFQPKGGFDIGYISWLVSIAIALCSGLLGELRKHLLAKSPA